MNKKIYYGEAEASLRKFTDIAPRCLRHAVLGLSMLFAGAAGQAAYAADIADMVEERIENSDERSTSEAEKIFDTSELPASFPGGNAALMRWIGTNMHYPESAQESGVQGRVMVKFVIEKDGSITNPTVVRSVNQALDKEAVRVVLMMPKWAPARLDGQAVRVYCTLPITFRLCDN